MSAKLIAEHQIGCTDLARGLTNSINRKLSQLTDLSGQDPLTLHLLTMRLGLGFDRSLFRPVARRIVCSTGELLVNAVDQFDNFARLLCEELAPSGDNSTTPERHPAVFWAFDLPDNEDSRGRLFELPGFRGVFIVPESLGEHFQDLISGRLPISEFGLSSVQDLSISAQEIANSQEGIAAAVDHVLQVPRNPVASFLPYETQGVYIVNGPTADIARHNTRTTAAEN